MSSPRTFTDTSGRRSPLGLLVFWALILGGLGCVSTPLVSAALEQPDQAAGTLVVLAQLLCNPCVLGVLGFLTFMTYKGLQVPTVAVLEDTHLRVPANGTRAVYTVGLDEGYRYSPKKGVLSLRVPYDRITEVRRPSTTERAEIGQRGRHYTISVNRRVRKVRGHDLDAEGAPEILDEELKGGWVSDPASAVAIHLDRIQREDQVYPMFPDVLVDVVLYVSCDEPDALVEALTAKIVGIDPAQGMEEGDGRTEG